VVTAVPDEKKGERLIVLHTLAEAPLEECLEKFAKCDLPALWRPRADQFLRIWHYPGFPSLFVTYNVANDYFFSGHTGIAVFGAIELARFRRTWLTALAAIVVVFEIAAVLVLRAHYTMDVFTGIVAALWVAHASEWLSQRFNPLAARSKPEP
jgi:membrane-associated phospholipid phosphatase